MTKFKDLIEDEMAKGNLTVDMLSKEDRASFDSFEEWLDFASETECEDFAERIGLVDTANYGELCEKQKEWDRQRAYNVSSMRKFF